LFGAAIFGIHAAQKNSAVMRFRASQAWNSWGTACGASMRKKSTVMMFSEFLLIPGTERLGLPPVAIKMGQICLGQRRIIPVHQTFSEFTRAAASE
jgi:hypothetical protein